MGDEFTNCNLLPSKVIKEPWIYENKDKNKNIKYNDTGKWMLYYKKSLIDEAWILAKKLYKENKLNGVISMKCSTLYDNPRASNSDTNVIILYCNNSYDESNILNIGKKIIKMFKYKEQNFIYYKTDIQTFEGTKATGKDKNHKYKLHNPYHKIIYSFD